MLCIRKRLWALYVGLFFFVLPGVLLAGSGSIRVEPDQIFHSRGVLDLTVAIENWDPHNANLVDDFNMNELQEMFKTQIPSQFYTLHFGDKALVNRS
jgi:hypothetical protein